MLIKETEGEGKKKNIQQPLVTVPVKVPQITKKKNMAA